MNEAQRNTKQKEILAQFYSNLALAVLTVGFVTPLFTGIRNPFIFILQFIVIMIIAGRILLIALEFVK